AWRRWSNGSWVERYPRRRDPAKERPPRERKVLRPHPVSQVLRGAAQTVPPTGVSPGLTSKRHRPALGVQGTRRAGRSLWGLRSALVPVGHEWAVRHSVIGDAA